MAPKIEREDAVAHELGFPHYLSNHLSRAADEATSFRVECLAISSQVDVLSDNIRIVVYFTTASCAVYIRPISLIAAKTTATLQRALNLVKKCKHSGVLRQLYANLTFFSAEFKKVLALLESCVADLRWIVSVLRGEEGRLETPPIARKDPMIASVWSSIATLHVTRSARDRIDAANNLALLARSNEGCRDLIVQEGAVKQLLQLLQDGGGYAEGQVAAAAALCLLAENNVKRCEAIVRNDNNQGITVVGNVLEESRVSVQITVAELVEKIFDAREVSKQEFVRNILMKSLISCLILHSSSTDCSSSRGYESPQEKRNVMIKCSWILWRMHDKSLSYCAKIGQADSLFCLAKIIETEKGESKLNCLMTIKEVAEASEAKMEIRKVIWHPKSPPVKAVLDQLLRLINEESSPVFLIPAIKAVGYLARIFSWKETDMVVALVDRLGDKNMRVATEAVIALTKFIGPGNVCGGNHSKKIIKFNGLPMVMKLLSASDRARLVGLEFLCYLSVHAGNSNALADARVMITLESAVSSGMARHRPLKDLIPKAIEYLNLHRD
ncbi:hypothetical protein vseg_003160 [Gypsophila vaccaria]